MSAIPETAVSDADRKEKGGHAEACRPIGETMLNILKDAPAAQGPLAFVQEGFTAFSPLEANAILKEAAYDRQRKISADHVSVLADLMRRKEWEPRDKVDFALLNDRLILVNGYHRMTAQVMSGATIEWTVVIHRCKDEEAVRSLYYKFDTNTRVRTSSQIMAGVDFAGTHGLNGKVASALFNAVPVIASGFKYGHKAKDVLTNKVMDRRLRVAGEYVAAAKKFQACLDGAPVKIRSKLLRGGVTAVALVTVRYQPIRAVEFWTGVVQNDGLRKGDARLALHNDLLSRNIDANAARAMTSSYIPARAWNAFFFAEDLQQIRVPSEPVISIAGTPYEE